MGANRDMQIANPKLMNLGFISQNNKNEQNFGTIQRNEEWSMRGNDNGPMELGLEEENVPVDILDVNLKSFSSFHNDVEISDIDGGENWRLTGFYGNPIERDRGASWNLLRQLSGDCNTPLVVGSLGKELEQRLEGLYSQDISDDVLAEIVEARLDLNLEADKEELYWEQRARVNWLKDRDRNTSFFHKMAGLRHFHGKISELIDANGIRHSAPKEMVKMASDYFEDLFTASEIGVDEHIFSLVDSKVTGCMNESLLKPFSEEEVWKAHYWHIMGAEVSRYCLAVLNGQIEVGDINRMRIVLIPKVDRPKNMSQFRPISLCNVIYKIITKMLVGRMSDILGVCINEAQGAFIPGRLISDNVLIAYEVLHSLKMKKNGKKRHFALKLDMSKAYDRVE
ncbi:reverse transcriptase [Gossypium australe]|uniref:Reverse transcriptase n=1 Tax=Gossypium australe TaxID=47621 RepID=A0A5B6W153_9ROSI|nr:reverse transcriptase [Gossypium australe]